MGELLHLPTSTNINALEKLAKDGIDEGLWQRIRNDDGFRKAMVEQAKALDKSMAGESHKLLVNYDLSRIEILSNLVERPWSGLLLGADIIENLRSDVPEQSGILEVEFVAVPLYYYLSREKAGAELRRRGLQPVSCIEALRFFVIFAGDSIAIIRTLV